MTSTTTALADTAPVAHEVDAGRTAAAPRSLRHRLIVPFAGATALQIVLATGDRLPAVDTLAYLQAGRNLLGGVGYTRFGAPELHFPPLVPVGLRLLVLAGIAVVVLLAGLADRLWRDDGVTVAVAWLAGAVAGLGPLFFRHGSGSESASLALILGALLLALAAVDHQGRGRHLRLLGSGGLVGLAYLARPEALLVGLVIGLATVTWVGRHSGPLAERLRPAAAAGGAFLVGAAVLVAPYVGYLHAHTGSWSLTAKSQDVSIDAWRAVAEGHRRERDQFVYALTPDGTQLNSEARPLTQLAAEHPAAWLGIVRTSATKVAQTYLAPEWGYGIAWQAVPGPLIALALIELWHRRRRGSTRLLAVIALLPVATCLAFFTLPRYLVLTTAVLTLFAAAGLVRWSRALPRRWALGLVVAVGVLIAMSTLTEIRPLLPGQATADPLSHQHVGQWLATHTPPDARVMTRSFHVQAYAERPIVAMPVADYSATLRFARFMGVTYLVAEPRWPLYDTLQAGPPAGLRAVAAFGSLSRPVVVYELEPPPQPSEREPIPLGYVGD